MKVKCPICGVDLDVELNQLPKPVGGLWEAVVIHSGHCFKMYLDETNFVRRTSPALCIHADELTTYVNGDRAVIVDRSGIVEIPGGYIKNVILVELEIKKWGTKT